MNTPRSRSLSHSASPRAHEPKRKTREGRATSIAVLTARSTFSCVGLSRLSTDWDSSRVAIGISISSLDEQDRSNQQNWLLRKFGSQLRHQCVARAAVSGADGDRCSRIIGGGGLDKSKNRCGNQNGNRSFTGYGRKHWRKYDTTALCQPRTRRIPGNQHLHIEFPAVWPYSIYADEFVRRAVCNPGGGEMSGLTAHFFFGANFGACLGSCNTG